MLCAACIEGAQYHLRDALEWGGVGLSFNIRPHWNFEERRDCPGLSLDATFKEGMADGCL
jgi:hypothetical protein